MSLCKFWYRDEETEYNNVPMNKSIAKNFDFGQLYVEPQSVQTWHGNSNDFMSNDFI